MSDQIWEVTYQDNLYGKSEEKIKEFEEPVQEITVIKWRQENGHVIKSVRKTEDRVNWEDITKISSWR
jgi:hypothetical protein